MGDLSIRKAGGSPSWNEEEAALKPPKNEYWFSRAEFRWFPSSRTWFESAGSLFFHLSYGKLTFNTCTLQLPTKIEIPVFQVVQLLLLFF